MGKIGLSNESSYRFVDQAAHQNLQHHNVVQCQLVTVSSTRCESQHRVCCSDSFQGAQWQSPLTESSGASIKFQIQAFWQAGLRLQRAIRSSLHSSGQQIIVIQPIIVLQHLPLDFGSINPCDKVLHVSRDQECWLSDCLRANSHMSLLNESDGFPE